MGACFVDIGALVKTQLENGLSKLFDFRGQTIYVSDQAVFVINNSSLRDEEGKKINVNELLTAAQRQSGHFLFLAMMVHPDQAGPTASTST